MGTNHPSAYDIQSGQGVGADHAASAGTCAQNNTIPEHDALDLDCNVGDDVFSGHSGKVVKVNRDASKPGGKHVFIRHSNGDTSEYLHLDSIRDEIQVGTKVGVGAKIGTCGKTGTQQPHLHLATKRPDADGVLQVKCPQSSSMFGSNCP